MTDGIMARKRRRGNLVDGYPDYPEDVMVAVKYLVEKGVTKSTEIAKRLGVCVGGGF